MDSGCNECKCWLIIGALDAVHHQFVRHILDYMSFDAKIFILNDEEIEQSIYSNYSVTYTTFFSLDKLLSTEQMNVILLPVDINLADSMHEMYNIYTRCDVRIDKIVSIADARYFVEKKHILLDALAYFADILFIYDPACTLSKSQVSEYIHACKKQECYPLPIEYVTKKNVHFNELYFDSRRRMTLIYDDIDPIDLLQFDEHNLPSDSFTIPSIDQMDKYLMYDSIGKRVHPIPEFYD